MLGEVTSERLLNLLIFFGDGEATEKALIGEVISLLGYHLYFLDIFATLQQVVKLTMGSATALLSLD